MTADQLQGQWNQFKGELKQTWGADELYLSEQRNDRIAEVRTKLSGRKTDTLLDFWMTDRAGTWLVYDVVIDGASVVYNYRAQFASIIREAPTRGWWRECVRRRST